MPTGYPTSLDTSGQLPSAAALTGTKLDGSDGEDHVAISGTVHEAIRAIQTKLGIDSSADTTSIDYKVANRQPLDSDLTAIAALSTTSFGRSVLALADAAALRTLAGLGTAAVSNTGDFDAAGAAAAAQAASQPLDSDLTTIAGLTATTDNMIQSVGGAWASRTPTQVKAALAIAESDVTNLTTDLAAKQPLDSDLTAIAALTTTSYGRAFLALANAAAAISALGLDADIATLALPASTTISVFAATFLDDVDAATVRATLGLGAASLLADPITAAHGGTGLTTLTAHGLVVGEGTSTPTFVGPDSTSTKILQSAGSSADPAFVAMSGDVTLAAGGAATISNLAVTNAKIAASTIDLTAKVTGILPVANGGQGANTLAAHGVVIGNGTSAVAVTSAGSSGQVLTSNGASADPTFQALDITAIANGAIVTILARNYLK
jgi:hypothetical protein